MAAISPCHIACRLFDVLASAYYGYFHQREHKIVKDISLRAKLAKFFSQSKGAAGSRTLLIRLKSDGFTFGRYKVRTLMKTMKLVSKQIRNKHRCPTTD